MFRTIVALSVIGIVVTNPGAVASLIAVAAIGQIANKYRK